MLRFLLTYATAVSCNTAPTYMHRLKVLQDKCLRLILNENRYARIEDMHERANIPVISDYVDE